MKTSNFITVTTADIIDGEIYYVQKVEKRTEGIWVVSTIVEMKNFKTYNLAKVMQKTVTDFMAQYLLDQYDTIMGDIDFFKSSKQAMSKQVLAAEQERLMNQANIAAFIEKIQLVLSGVVFLFGRNTNKKIGYAPYDALKDLLIFEGPKMVDKQLYEYDGKPELLASVSQSLLAEGRFVEKSVKKSIDEMLCYIPDVERWDIVKNVNFKNWYKDDFFANELFNGLNPYTVKVVETVEDIPQEFLSVKDTSGTCPIQGLVDAKKLFLTKYDEVFNWGYHTDQGFRDSIARGIYMMNSETLTYEDENGKLRVLAIGFYFPNNANRR